MTGYVYTFGETMGLYRTTEIGGLETATDAKIGVGGADSNVAIGVSRLGVNAVWTGRVGDDGLGRRVIRELRAEGVTVKAIVDPSAPTGLMLKEKRTAETTRVYFYRSDSAGSRITEHDLDNDLIRGAAVLHVSGITASMSTTGERAVFAAIETARDAGVPVSFDVNHRSSLWPTGDPGRLYRRIVALTDILFCGVDEARLILPRQADDPTDLANYLAQLGPMEIIVKLGAAGSTGIIDGEPFHRGAYKVQALDTVGAGDGFVAGYISARMQGAPPAARIERATAAGAFACLGGGDWESLPRMPDLALLGAADPVAR